MEEILQEKFFLNMNDFSMHIEEEVLKTGIGYIECLLNFCEINGAEYDTVASLLSPSLKQKIYDEAAKTYSMPKETTSKLDDT